MLRKSFNCEWTIAENDQLFSSEKTEGKPVMLPYDDMLNNKRSPDAPSKSHTGYFPDVVIALKKKFTVPEDWKDRHVVIEFEGVYRSGMVYVNNDYAGGCPHGYTNFYVNADQFLKYGAKNEIKVLAKTSKDSRWYTGVGAYRNVKLMVSDLLHIVPDSYRVTTPEIDDQGAAVTIEAAYENLGHNNRTVTVFTEILDAQGEPVACGEEKLTVFCHGSEKLRQRLYLKNPRRWDADAPYLYTVRTKILDSEEALDEEICKLGVRSLALDMENGLRVNGKMVKLRGACVHHDNGVVGAAAIERAEERRVELLKEAGFNAIRSSHYPISKAFIEACDKHGMYVMDELTDMWMQSKTDYDYSTAFPQHWEQAAKAMVDKDFNHPSVVMYSIGNEIPELGSKFGGSIGRKIGEQLRALDNTRYTINSANLMLAIMDQLSELRESGGGNEINEMMTSNEDVMGELSNSEIATKGTVEAFTGVDIAGYNYATVRYENDKKLFPNRILCGSETFPKQIANNWKVIMENNHVIGDFTWTGWDYLGEAGIGKMEYKEDSVQPGFYGAYPWFIAYCGDLDIIGNRRPVSYYREIVFGLRKEPYIAVQYPKNHGKTLIPGMWDFMDGISSWTWNGFEGKPIQVEVYGDGDRAELLLNGNVAVSGGIDEFRAILETVYEPGDLTAIVYKDGVETGRYTLKTAESQVKLCTTADREEIRADDTDLAYIMISFEDEAGVVNNQADRKVTVKAEGAGFLLGLGSANPKSEENFRDGSYSTFDGYALAVIRPTEAGEIQVTVEAEGCDTQTLTIQAI